MEGEFQRLRPQTQLCGIALDIPSEKCYNKSVKCPNSSAHFTLFPSKSEVRVMDTGNRGKLIVLEGLDGSGKATQAARLKEALEGSFPVRQVSFPDYQSDSSALVRMYLAGQFGSDPADVSAYAASSFYAVDRYASFKRDWGEFYRRGGLVIADRYTTSNAIHQCSKLPEAEWEGYLSWLFDYEYRLLGIPAPDLVLYLQVDPAVSQRLMTARYGGAEDKKDIHERNLSYLRRSRTAAEFCAARLGWHVIHCTRDGEMRSIEEIHGEILGAVQSLCGGFSGD